MKLKTIQICSECQYKSPKWLGRCPECNAWNSFSEDVVNVGKPAKSSLSKTPRLVASPVSISNHTPNPNRTSSAIEEFDRVMGGGIVAGSLTLLSGEPGIGKSTLTLQIANNIAKENKVLIISGEESIDQIVQRAKRLKATSQNLKVLNEFNLENIIQIVKSEKPDFVIIDSIQVISSTQLPSAAGSVAQVRYCADQIMELAKSETISTLLIGHVNKDGNLAGPRVLEHLVDTVLHLEGDRFQNFRILKTAKNRFGSCNEIGIFAMNESGLEEIKNPSAHLLDGRKENAIGSTITITMEGTRPLLVEVQALVSKSNFGYPKRTSNGFDLSRLQILIAVLQKHGKLNLENQDVFVNVVGGIKLTEPAADLAVLTAIASSLLKKTLPKNSAIFGEVGLSGELRQCTHHEKRIKEAQKLGFPNVVTPQDHKDIISALKKTLQRSE